MNNMCGYAVSRTFWCRCVVCAHFAVSSSFITLSGLLQKLVGSRVRASSFAICGVTIMYCVGVTLRGRARWTYVDTTLARRPAYHCVAR